MALKLRYAVATLAVCLGANALAAAATLKGTARNGTTGKPASGDEVVIFSPANGTTESGRGKTDAGGRFSIAVDDARASRVVRVIHQGVAYHTMAPPGVKSVEVQVYDVAQKLDGVTATRAEQWLQTEGSMLQVIEEIAVRNASHPPRTLLNDRPFEIQLPPEAEVVGGKVQLGGGQPLTRQPTPGGEKGRYYFPFPLLPGESRFAVAYLLPYRGEAVIEPMILYPLKQFAVVLPKSMKFEAKSPGVFQPMPGRPGANVYGTAAGKPGQPVAFRVSGTGTLAGLQGGQQQAQVGKTARPGGGPGAPARLPGVLHSDRWLILGGLVLILAAVAAGVARARARKLNEGRL